MDPCEIPRWQLLKNQLNNLSYKKFISELKKDQNALCIDVRTADEYQGSHLPGAINLNYLSENLADKLEKLDPDLHYYIYCRTGRRSLRICVLLKNMGFAAVYNLEVGIVNYQVD